MSKVTVRVLAVLWALSGIVLAAGLVELFDVTNLGVAFFIGIVSGCVTCVPAVWLFGETW